MARQPTPRSAPRKRRADELIVSLDEFASLCGVTPETMRTHLKGVGVDADWILERGRRGVGYKIAAERAVAWWRSRSAGAGEDVGRQQKLAELRLQMLGGDAGEEDVLLPGKQRYEEFKAGEAELAYRQAIGELCRAADLEGEIANAVIEHRRQLQTLARAVRRKLGLDRDAELVIEGMVRERVDKFVKALDGDDDGAAAG